MFLIFYVFMITRLAHPYAAPLRLVTPRLVVLVSVYFTSVSKVMSLTRNRNKLCLKKSIVDREFFLYNIKVVREKTFELGFRNYGHVTQVQSTESLFVLKFFILMLR